MPYNRTGTSNNAPDIDLTTLIPQLDTVASDIVAHQRDTLTQRKDLAQKTKDFRKLDDASKLNDIKTLLKCEGPGRASTRVALTSNHSIPELHRPHIEPVQNRPSCLLPGLLSAI